MVDLKELQLKYKYKVVSFTNVRVCKKKKVYIIVLIVDVYLSVTFPSIDAKYDLIVDRGKIMKKISILIFILFLLAGCSDREKKSVKELFSPYTDGVFVAKERALSKSRLEEQGVYNENLFNLKLYGASSNGIHFISFNFGVDADDELFTLDVFDSENPAHVPDKGYSNIFDLEYSFEDLIMLGNTNIFVHLSDVRREANMIYPLEPLYYFDANGEAPTLYQTDVLNLAEKIGFKYKDYMTQIDIKELEKALIKFKSENKDESLEEHLVEKSLYQFEHNKDSRYDTYLHNIKSIKVLSPEKGLGLGDSFNFDDLDITISNSSNWGVISNRFSDNNGDSVLLLDIEIRNNSATKRGLNMFQYDIYGPDGTKIKSVSPYFDNNVDFAGDILPGGKQKALFPVLYSGDGEYTIIFDNHSEQKTVKFNIKK